MATAPRPRSTSSAAHRLRGTVARWSVAVVVVACAVPLGASPAAADPSSTAGRIAFQAGGQLATARADGTDVVALTTLGGTQPTWSPDGSRVAFVRGSDVWSKNADGTDEQRLTSLGGFQPTWSPDGLSIAFVSARGTNGQQVWVMDADGSGESQLTSVAGMQPSSPAWSPDGSTLVFNGGTGLFVVRADGSGLTRLTTGTDLFPAWAPDGSAVLFSRPNGPNRDLYRISPGGTGLAPVTTTPDTDELRPSVSPDGQHVVYDSATGTTGIRGLVVADVNGSNPTSLGTAGVAFDAEWSPAGSGGGPDAPPGTGSGSTSAGQTLDVAITSPAPASERPASADPLEVSGTVGLSAASTRAYNAAYVVDVSGSTGSVTNRDCDGSHTLTPADDTNGDGRVGDILDCELAAALRLNAAVAAVPTAVAGVVALGGDDATSAPPSVLADMSPATGDQGATPAGAIETGQAQGHVETVLRSMRAGLVGRYTSKPVGQNTDYNAALSRMNAFFVGRTSPATNVAYFMSDGLPTTALDTTLDGPLQMAVYRGVRVFTYAVGSSAGSCAVGQPLQVVAARTGGSCTAVTSPDALVAAVATPATLSSVRATLDSGAPVDATVDATATPPTWTASLPGGLPPGLHTLTAVAAASDGSTVTATSTVTGLAPPAVDAGGPYTVDEGSTVTLAGTATDPDGGAAPTVAWTPDAGLTDAGTLTPTYAGGDDGSVTVTLTATDDDGLSASDTAEVTTVNVAPAPGAISLSPRPVTGTPFDLSVDFTDPGTADSHTATVDWGDGTTEPATVTEADGDGTVSGTHTYSSGGDRTVTVTVTDDDAGTASTQTDPFRVNTAPTADAGGPYVVTEGTPLSLAGTATDADADPLTVAWTPADRLADPSSPTSAYDTTDDADELLTLTVDDGDLTATASAQVTVRNAAPEVGAVSGPTGVVTPGQEVEVSAPFTDAGTADTHTATVDWGDGTRSGPAAAAGTASARHTYASGGTWTVTVTVTDDDGDSGTATTTVVTNRAPVVDAGSDVTVDEGGTAVLAATATDPDGDALGLAWTPAGAVANPTVEDATVNAADDGTSTLTLTATDPFGAAGSDTVDVTVRNVPPTVPSLAAVPGSPATGSTVRVTGTWTDPGSLDTHTAVVDWGDGSTGPATVAAGTLSAEHTYARAGLFRVTATVTDDDGGRGSRAIDELVVHDPSGWVAGKGTFDSPAGAVRSAPTSAGRATFAVAAAYLPFLSVPVGVTSLELSRPDFRFTSVRTAWLVVDGATATWTGTGYVDGRPGYSFSATAVDGGRRADSLRIRVWDTATGAVAYDNGAAGTTLRTGSLDVGS